MSIVQEDGGAIGVTKVPPFFGFLSSMSDTHMKVLSSLCFALFLAVAAGCGASEKVTMPTKTYDPPTMEDVGTAGGSSTEADAPDK